MAFAKDLTALHTRGKKGSVKAHKGKGAAEQVLPSRHAVQTLTQGDPMQRTMQDYSKATPTGAGTPPQSDNDADDMY